MQRRLAAILAADVAGYSRLMEADEAGTLARLKSLYDGPVLPTIAEHRGRLVKLMGDGLLAEFSSAVDAVRCAIAVQKIVAEQQALVPEDGRLVFRMGVNLDNVIAEENDIFGDSVNVAARLEGMAEPGGVLISQSAHDDVAAQLDTVFFDNGLRKFKNISRAIRVWSWPRQLPSLRAQGKPRVFVANFEGRSPEEARLGADLSDGIKAHFARLTGLEVATDRAQAHYVVQGSLRLAANRSRVVARLAALEADRQIWSERYDEDTDDPFEIVDRCTPRIATSIRRHVASDDAARLANRPPDELSFEELLTHAGASFFVPTRSGWHKGGKIAEQALELNPKSFMALAMAAAGEGLADYLYSLRKPDEDVTGLAFKRIEGALRLNPEATWRTRSTRCCCSTCASATAMPRRARAALLSSTLNTTWVCGRSAPFRSFPESPTQGRRAPRARYNSTSATLMFICTAASLPMAIWAPGAMTRLPSGS
jgi:adenylate cyclase